MDAYSLRIRKEYNSRDAINSRAWDFFHATPPVQVSAAGLRGKPGPVHMDMNPICSRTNTIAYRNQPQYIPDPVRGSGSGTGTSGSGSTKADGIAPAASSVSVPPTSFSQNPYLQRLNAAAQDGHNIIREMRGAVVEDNLERTTDAERSLVARQFQNRWLSPATSIEYGALSADELLRSQLR